MRLGRAMALGGTIAGVSAAVAAGATVPPGWRVLVTATGIHEPAAVAYTPPGSSFTAGLYVAYEDAAQNTLGLVARIGAGGALVPVGDFTITYPSGIAPIFRNTASYDLLFDRPGGAYGGGLLIANGGLLSLPPAGGTATTYGTATQAAFMAASSDGKALIDGIVFGADGVLHASEGEGTDDLFRVDASGAVTLEASRSGASDINNPRLDRHGVYGGGLLFPQLFISSNNDLDEIGGQVIGDALATVLLSNTTLVNPFGAAIGDDDAELGSLLYLSDFGPASDPGPADDIVYRLLAETSPPTLDPLVTNLDLGLRGGHLCVGPGSDGLGSSLYLYESATQSILEIVPPRTGGLTITNPAATVANWGAAADATSYDVVRGDVISLAQNAVEVDLGTVLCVENDSTDLTTAGFSDAVTPASKRAFFYLYRFASPAGPGDYGRSTKGLPRFPLSGDCPP